MTDVLTLRRCSVCGVLESDLSSVFVFDQASQDVIHLVGNGMRRCGVLAVVPDERNEK
jgi:hypothetical protein